jgi:hypothetical protein
MMQTTSFYGSKALYDNARANNLYYSEDLGEEMLELSDNHTLWKIHKDFDMDYYYQMCDYAIADLSSKYNTQFYMLGRSGRHICVENTSQNRRRFKSLVKAVIKKENEIVAFFNE